MRVSRRRFLGAAAANAAALSTGCLFRPDRLDDMRMSLDAQAFVSRCWEGIDPTRVIDVHVHVVGLGAGGTGCSVHEDSQSWLSPLRLIKTRFYKLAAGIFDDDHADRQFVDRLLDLVRHRPKGTRSLLLAFDRHHLPDGTVHMDETEFHTPNDYVLELCGRHPDLFLAACSVHPYRADAVDELERCADRGALAVKWLPNAMGIDPLDPRCEPFYDVLAARGLVLLSHTGEEQAVEAEEAQELGNPLRLRAPLDRGVKVIAAHCASLGESLDLDVAPDASGERPLVSCYELYRRLAAEPDYRGLLHGGISAMTQFNRCEEPLAETLASPELHPSLVNGSDYPLPAVNPIVRTGLLEDLGYITEDERSLLNEVYDYNPLEFDFAVKRTLKLHRDGHTYAFPASVFETASLFGL
jgi:uncharacterized protein